MLFRQLFDFPTSTYTYLLADQLSGDALLIDSVKERVDDYIKLLNELNLKLKIVLDTHLHADHVTGMGLLKEKTGCSVLQGEPSRSSGVNRIFRDDDLISVGILAVRAIYTPGHTDDSYCFLLEVNNNRYLFTGDTLLIRGTGRTDFQNGSARSQYKSLFNRLLVLPEDTWVYPGHDYHGMTVSTLREEKRFNPRLQVGGCDDYVTRMDALSLPRPRNIDQALPANLHLGLTALSTVGS